MAEGKFVISAQNKIKEGLDGAKKDLLGFEDAATKVGKTIQSALTVTAITMGLKKLGEAAFDCFKEFAEGERRLTQLKLALNGNEASFTKATNLIDDMRKMSLASKDDIEGLVAELAALGKSDAEIEAITTAAVNLSNVTGKDLNASFTLINATYAGTTGRLTQLLPEIGNLTKEELAAGGATKAINDRFTELSQNLANGDALQNLKNLKDGFSDLKENIGELTAGVFSGFTSLLSDFVENLNTAFGKYKAFLGAKNALNFEDKAKNLLISKGYYELDTTAAGKAVRDRVNFLMQEAKRQDPGIQGQELNKKVEALKLNDPSYQAAVAWAADVAEKLKGVNTQLEKIKAETGIDYATTFNAGALRTTTTGGAPLGNKPLTDVELMAKFAPDSSMAGYIFAKQFYEQFEKGITENQNSAPEFGGGVGWMGQSAIPGPIGAGGASIFEQVYGSIDNLAESFRVYGTKAFGQSSVSPEGYAPRSDFFEQLYSALSLSSSQVSDQAAAVQYGKEYRDSFQKFTAGETLKQTISKQLNENTKVSSSLAPSGVLADILKGANAPTTVPWKMGDKQTFGQSGLTPAGLAKGRSDFTEQLVTDLIIPASLKAAQDGAMVFGKSYRDAMDAWDASQDTANTLDAMWSEALDQMAADYKTKPGSMGQSGITPAGTNPTPITDQIAALFPDVLSQITAGMTGAFDTVTASMGSFDAAMIGPITTIMEALGPFGEMLAGMNPLLALLIPIIEGFASVIGPAITEVLAPLFNALTQVGQMLGAALLPILDALMPIFSLLANLIITNFTPILQLLAPVIQIIALVFQSMSPVLVLLTKAFTILMSPIQYIADLFSWLGGVIKTFAWNIAHPFKQEGYSGFSSDAFSGLAARLAAIDAMGTNNQTLTASYSQSDATATQSANYRTQPITVNIYQQAPVVGSDGMSEFARMIRGEIEMLAYAGA